MGTHHLGNGMLAALGCAASLSALAAASPAYAGDGTPGEVSGQPKSFDLSDIQVDGDRKADVDPPSAVATHNDPVAEKLAVIAAELRAQRELIVRQNEIILRQQIAIDMLNGRQVTSPDLNELRGAGMGQAISPTSQHTTQMMPDAPVGEAPPPEPSVQSRVEAVPEGQGVLTPAGSMVLDSSFE
jgi:hypothetical protein